MQCQQNTKSTYNKYLMNNMFLKIMKSVDKEIVKVHEILYSNSTEI